VPEERRNGGNRIGFARHFTVTDQDRSKTFAGIRQAGGRNSGTRRLETRTAALRRFPPGSRDPRRKQGGGFKT
jgi:hypothetical protein